MPPQNIMVVLDEEHLEEAAVTAAVAAVAALGFEIGRVVVMAGSFRATGDVALLPALRAIAGVREASPEPRFRLPPDGASIQ